MNKLAKIPLQSLLNGKFKFTPVGLLIAEDVSFEDWQEVGVTLQRFDNAIQFAIGDWINFGDRKYGEMYSQALEETGYKTQTLMNYAFVSKNVAISRRREEVPFSQHAEVAKLEPKEQEYYLDLAIQNGWSVKELRTQIKQRNIIKRLKEAAENKNISNDIIIIHGDMLEFETANLFDLIIADPPYNVTPYAWDQFDSSKSFLLDTCDWLEKCRTLLKSEYNLFWFCSPYYMADIEMLMRDLKLPIQSRIVWNRRNMAMGSDAVHKFIDSWEMIYHVGNRELNFSGEWDSSRFDVQTFSVPQTNFNDQKFHPTQKPLKLIQWLVKHGSYPGDHVLDPFAGSGTTGHAALLEGDRHCTLIEKEYEYVDIIRARLAVL